MLRNILRVVSPQLLAILHEIGYTDTIVLGDSNFPAKTCVKRREYEYH